MELKAQYLSGSATVAKEAFRRLAIEGEQFIAGGEVSAMSDETARDLDSMPVAALRELKGENFRVLSARLSRLPWLKVLQPESPECVPFSVVVVLGTEQQREEVRTYLIANNAYPSILWPLERALYPVSQGDLALSRCSISLHCDARYSHLDLDRLAGIFEAVGRT